MTSPYHLGSAPQEQDRLTGQVDLYGDTKRITFKPTDRVCEFGCGPLANAWIPQSLSGGSFVGVDIQPEQIAVGKERAKNLKLLNVDLRVGDARNTELPASSFDVSYARLLLIHVPDPASIVAEMMRVTKNGGRIIVTEPHDQGYFATPGTENLLKCFRARNIYAYGNGRGSLDIALQLYPLFQSLGLKDIHITPHVITATGAIPGQCTVLLKNWIGLIYPVVDDLLREKLVTEAEWQQAQKEAEEERPDRFVLQMLWIAEGVKG
ncbi:MAG: methyltransferase domain-containing protein [Candidatus Peregrinibacteria bacterium]